MRPTIAAIAFLATAIPLIADEKEDALKKLNGTYEVTSLLLEGKADDSKKDGKITFVIKDGTITIKEEKKDEKATFTIDPTKKPAHIDIMPERDKKTIPGIYEVKETDKGTELTIAFIHDGGERPKDFKGEGKESAVLKLFRKKVK